MKRACLKPGQSAGTMYMRTLNRIVSNTSLLMLLLVSSFSSLAHAEVVNISNEALQKLVAEGVTLVDLRRADEWKNTGVVEGSQLMTFFDAEGKFDAEDWLAQLGSIIEPDAPVILICHSGNRSSMVSRWLSEKVGLEKVYNVTDGIVSWKANGGPTVQP